MLCIVVVLISLTSFMFDTSMPLLSPGDFIVVSIVTQCRIVLMMARAGLCNITFVNDLSIDGFGLVHPLTVDVDWIGQVCKVTVQRQNKAIAVSECEERCIKLYADIQCLNGVK